MGKERCAGRQAGKEGAPFTQPQASADKPVVRK